jgi:hypothetical protein
MISATCIKLNLLWRKIAKKTESKVLNKEYTCPHRIHDGAEGSLVEMLQGVNQSVKDYAGAWVPAAAD